MEILDNNCVINEYCSRSIVPLALFAWDNHYEFAQTKWIEFFSNSKPILQTSRTNTTGMKQ